MKSVNCPAMEMIRNKKLHRRSQKKQRNDISRRVPPDGGLPINRSRVGTWDKGHVDYADDECRDGEDDSGNDSPENVPLFADLETTRAFFQGDTFFEGGDEVVSADPVEDCAEGDIGWGGFVANYNDRIFLCDGRKVDDSGDVLESLGNFVGAFTRG